MPVDSYTIEKARAICDHVASGKSLVHICSLKGMPKRDVVYAWLHKSPEFREMYDSANARSLEAMADDLIAIADDGTNDWMEIQIGNGNVKIVPDNEAIQRSKLRVDARKWIMAKRNPKKWGDNVSLGAEDGKGGGFKITISSVLSEEQDSA